MRNRTRIASLSDIQNVKYLLDNSDKIKIRGSKYEIVIFVKKRKLTTEELEAQEEIRSKVSDLMRED